jgi:hypothetical protein
MSKTLPEPRVPSRNFIVGWRTMAVQDAEAWLRISREYAADAERAKDPEVKATLKAIAGVYTRKSEAKLEECQAWEAIVSRL